MVNISKSFPGVKALSQVNLEVKRGEIHALLGENGAGKSTTMAGFVTTLIPDLTLLHFRNTTEAGSTGGSRDKGLHGKLRPGVCYAVLDTINSRHQRILVGCTSATNRRS